MAGQTDLRIDPTRRRSLRGLLASALRTLTERDIDSYAVSFLTLAAKDRTVEGAVTMSHDIHAFAASGAGSLDHYVLFRCDVRQPASLESVLACIDGHRRHRHGGVAGRARAIQERDGAHRRMDVQPPRRRSAGARIHAHPARTPPMPPTSTTGACWRLSGGRM